MTNGADCKPSRFERALAAVLLGALSLFIAWGFLPELRPGVMQYSDVTLHLAVLKQLDQAVRGGGSAFDFWFDASPFGYALFRSYQYLPHLIIYSTYRLAGGVVSLETLLPCFTLVLAALIPWVFFHAARVLRLPWWAALWCGLLAPLLIEQGGYGLGLRNYLWGTNGIIMQLWAVVFLVPAIAYAVEFVRSGRHGGILLSLTFMAVGSHILSAYVIIGTFVVACSYFFVTGALDRVIASRRIGLALLAFLVVTAHQWVFILADRAVIHRSTLEPEWKFASWGIEWVLSNLASGALFDLGRLPIITGLFLIGFAFTCASWFAGLKWKHAASDTESNVGVITLCFAVWGSILCGYQLWGWLFESLPVLSAMHLHRFVLPMQICGVFIAGYGAGLLLSVFPSPLIRTLLLVVVLILPVQGALQVFRSAHSSIDRVEEEQASEHAYKQIVEKLKTLPRGWVHGGMNKSWAKETAVGGVAPLYHLTVAEGVPTLGMLFHSMSLAGDLLFEFSPVRESDYKLFGVRYSVSPISWKLPSFLQPLAQIGPLQVSEYQGADPLSVEDLAFEGWGSAKDTVRYLQSWIHSALPEQHAFGRIVRGNVSGTTLAVPFSSISLDIPTRSTAPGRVIEPSQWESQRVSGTVELDREALVVFRSGYHPGWRALVDGVPHEVFSVTPGFLAISVGPGIHRIVFEYQASRTRPWLVLLALAVCTGLVRRDLVAPQRR